MKRQIKILGMLAVMVAISILGSAYLNYLMQQDLENKNKSARYSKEEICNVDRAYLKKHRIQPFISHLPVVMIDTEEQQLMKESEIWAKIGIYDEPTSENDIMGIPNKVIDCTVKLRGASSYTGFDKNQYRIKLYEKKNGKAYDYELADMGRHSEWVLHGPFLDKTLMRNKICYELGREILEWAPDSRYVEVFRDGKYEGVYLAVEPVTNGESRLKLSELGVLSGQTAYILKRDRVGTENNVINTWGLEKGKTLNELSIAYPSEKGLTTTQKEWILRDVSRFEKDLYEGKNNYEQYIDVENFVDYFILSEVALNYDSGKLSTYMYKELEGKLKLSIWDFNNSFNNYQQFSMGYTGFETVEAPWFDALIKDRAFVDRICQRYYAYRQGILRTDSVLSGIDDIETYLGEAISRNNKIWGYTFKLELLNSENMSNRNTESYADAVDQLKEAITKRLEYMDEHMTDLYRYCEE